MLRSLLSYAFLLSFLCGVFLLQWDTDVSRSMITWLGLGTMMILSAFGLRIWPKASFLLACSLGMTFAAGAVFRAALPPSPHHISHWTGRDDVLIMGSVAGEPDRRPGMTQYHVRVERIETETGALVSAAGKILLRDSKSWPRLHYGDRIAARGNVKKPWAIREFRYDRFLELQGISAILTAATFGKTGGGNVSPFRLLFAFKERFEGRIEQLLPEPHAAFLTGLLTGARRSLPKDVSEQFKATGTTHILAISGYNITIILTLMGGLLFWLPLRVRFFPLALGIAAFTLFTGASASVVRAAVMGILGLLALQLGRKQEIRLSILWTAFAMVAWKPQSFWYDAGFQLSFLAVLGLSEAGPLITPLTKRFPDTLAIRESAQATLSAQIMTLPWILFLFGRLSVVSPLANLLIAPLIPLAMLTGFLAVTLSVLWFPLGQLLAYAAWGILEIILRITAALAGAPFASLPVKIGAASTALLYGLLTTTLFILHYRTIARKKA